MTEFTTVPWTSPHVHKSPGGAPYAISIYGDKGRTRVYHATIGNGYDPEYQEAMANAHLIAAAPDLLAVLEEAEGLVAWLHGLNPHLRADTRGIVATFDNRRRGAIAKATE